KEENKKFIQFADKMLQKDDYLAFLVDKERMTLFYLLIRNQKEKLSISSGPHRITYLFLDTDNKIPDDILAVLDQAEQIELYSLKPEDFTWKELGKTVIKDAQLVKKVVAELKNGVEDSLGSGALCFNPRHRLKATHKGKKIDLVICFECLQVQSSIDGKESK